MKAHGSIYARITPAHLPPSRSLHIGDDVPLLTAEERRERANELAGEEYRAHVGAVQYSARHGFEVFRVHLIKPIDVEPVDLGRMLHDDVANGRVDEEGYRIEDVRDDVDELSSPDLWRTISVTVNARTGEEMGRAYIWRNLDIGGFLHTAMREGVGRDLWEVNCPDNQPRDAPLSLFPIVVVHEFLPDVFYSRTDHRGNFSIAGLPPGRVCLSPTFATPTVEFISSRIALPLLKCFDDSAHGVDLDLTEGLAGLSPLEVEIDVGDFTLVTAFHNIEDSVLGWLEDVGLRPGDPTRLDQYGRHEPHHYKTLLIWAPISPDAANPMYRYQDGTLPVTHMATEANERNNDYATWMTTAHGYGYYLALMLTGSPSFGDHPDGQSLTHGQTVADLLAFFLILERDPNGGRDEHGRFDGCYLKCRDRNNPDGFGYDIIEGSVTPFPNPIDDRPEPVTGFGFFDGTPKEPRSLEESLVGTGIWMDILAGMMEKYPAGGEVDAVERTRALFLLSVNYSRGGYLRPLGPERRGILLTINDGPIFGGDNLDNGSPDAEIIENAFARRNLLLRRFRRGDSDGGGRVEVTDRIATLNFLFLGASPPACADAADADNSGALELSDPVNIFNWLFLGGPAPSPLDGLGCEARPLGCL